MEQGAPRQLTKEKDAASSLTQTKGEAEQSLEEIRKVVAATGITEDEGSTLGMVISICDYAVAKSKEISEGKEPSTEATREGQNAPQAVLDAKDDAIVALFEIVQALTKADSQERLRAFKLALESVGNPSVLNAPKSEGDSEFPQTEKDSVEQALRRVAEQFAREDPESTDQNFDTMIEVYLRPMLAAVVNLPPSSSDQAIQRVRELAELIRACEVFLDGYRPLHECDPMAYEKRCKGIDGIEEWLPKVKTLLSSHARVREEEESKNLGEPGGAI